MIKVSENKKILSLLGLTLPVILITFGASYQFCHAHFFPATTIIFLFNFLSAILLSNVVFFVKNQISQPTLGILIYYLIASSAFFLISPAIFPSTPYGSLHLFRLAGYAALIWGITRLSLKKNFFWYDTGSFLKALLYVFLILLAMPSLSADLTLIEQGNAKEGIWNLIDLSGIVVVLYFALRFVLKEAKSEGLFSEDFLLIFSITAHLTARAYSSAYANGFTGNGELYEITYLSLIFRIISFYFIVLYFISYLFSGFHLIRRHKLNNPLRFKKLAVNSPDILLRLHKNGRLFPIARDYGLKTPFIHSLEGMNLLDVVGLKMRKRLKMLFQELEVRKRRTSKKRVSMLIKLSKSCYRLKLGSRLTDFLAEMTNVTDSMENLKRLKHVSQDYEILNKVFRSTSVKVNENEKLERLSEEVSSAYEIKDAKLVMRDSRGRRTLKSGPREELPFEREMINETLSTGKPGILGYRVKKRKSSAAISVDWFSYIPVLTEKRLDHSVIQHHNRYLSFNMLERSGRIWNRALMLIEELKGRRKIHRLLQGEKKIVLNNVFFSLGHDSSNSFLSNLLDNFESIQKSDNAVFYVKKWGKENIYRSLNTQSKEDSGREREYGWEELSFKNGGVEFLKKFHKGAGPFVLTHRDLSKIFHDIESETEDRYFSFIPFCSNGDVKSFIISELSGRENFSGSVVRRCCLLTEWLLARLYVEIFLVSEKIHYNRNELMLINRNLDYQNHRIKSLEQSMIQIGDDMRRLKKFGY